MELELAPFHLRLLLGQSLFRVKEKALKHRINLNTFFVNIPETLWADEMKMKQILYNLLSNAVKFTPDGGSVLLSANRIKRANINYEQNTQNPAKDTDCLEISIADSGIGLMEKDLTRIFEPFEQGDNSSGRKYKGPV